MAKLLFKYATMNSGKTIDLIRTAYNYEENNGKVILLKPKIDTKGEDTVVTRIGLSRKVDYLVCYDDSIFELLKGKLDGVDAILVDEAQFLSKPQVDELNLITKAMDINVICYGLRVNFRGELFNGSKKLLEVADKLEELVTLCECKKMARFVGRKVNGEYVTDGKEVVIDGEDSKVEYVPLCGDCYLTKAKKLDFKKIRNDLK
ncbi:MAG: thymidine kinase [Bacilli bacterium]|nr:thymidine kinase [Bacilli bacterium]